MIDVQVGHLKHVLGIQYSDFIVFLLGLGGRFTDLGTLFGKGGYCGEGLVEFLDQVARLSRFDGLDADESVMLKAGGPGDGRGNNHGDENIGNPR